MAANYGWDDLSDAYAQLQDQIQHVHSDYPETEDADPTSDDDDDDPSDQESHVPPPPESEIQKLVKERAQRLTVSRNHLVRRRGTLLTALEKLGTNRDWQAELDYWVRESQEAQIGALMNCLDLLLGVAGPVGEALRTHHYNGGWFWTRYLSKKGQLETIQEGLRNHEYATPEAERAALELGADIEALTKKICREYDLIDFYTLLEKAGLKIRRGVEVTRAVESCAEKHNLLFAAHQITEFIAGGIADMGLVTIEKTLIKEGALAWAVGVHLANFFIRFGYNSFRFSTAFSAVHTILADIDNSAATAERLRSLAGETTKRIRDIDIQLKQLQQVQGNDKQAARLLKSLKAERRQTAFNSGMGTAYALAASPEMPDRP